MPLESAQYISDLVTANPLSTDTVSQADDHIRLLKSVLRNTFPNLNGPVSATQSKLNNPIPSGVIVLWSGSVSNVPEGWSLCNGTSGTPDLRDRFVVGAGSSVAPGATGGSNSSSAAGSHTHTEAGAGGNTPSMAAAGYHNHGGYVGSTGLTVDQMPPHNHVYTRMDVAPVAAGGAGAVGITASSQYTSTTGSGAGHSHTIAADGSHVHAMYAIPDHAHTINSVGDHSHTVTPPFYALAYIMKL